MELDSRHVENASVPLVFLNAWVILGILGNAFGAIDQTKMFLLFGAVASIASIVFFLKFLKEYVAQEGVLFKLCEEQILRQKVDQVLREREIEKAASQIQEATYETPEK